MAKIEKKPSLGGRNKTLWFGRREGPNDTMGRSEQARLILDARREGLALHVGVEDEEGGEAEEELLELGPPREQREPGNCNRHCAEGSLCESGCRSRSVLVCSVTEEELPEISGRREPGRPHQDVQGWQSPQRVRAKDDASEQSGVRTS